MLFSTEITVSWVEYTRSGLGRRISHRKRCDSLVGRHVCLGDCTETGHKGSPGNLLQYVTDCPGCGGARPRAHLLQLNAEKCLMTGHGGISAWAPGLEREQATLLLAPRVGWEPHKKYQCLPPSCLT